MDCLFLFLPNVISERVFSVIYVISHLLPWFVSVFGDAAANIRLGCTGQQTSSGEP